MRSNRKSRSSLWKGFMWMVVIWLLSVLALGAVSMVFRLLMHAAGMRSD